jgi:hypothetical protein
MIVRVIPAVSVMLFTPAAVIEAQNSPPLPQGVVAAQPVSYENASYANAGYANAGYSNAGNANAGNQPANGVFGARERPIVPNAQATPTPVKPKSAAWGATRHPLVNGRGFVNPTFYMITAPSPAAPSPAAASPAAASPAAASPAAPASAQDLTAPGSPALFRINDLSAVMRGAPYYDSTRMDPSATGYFLPSAIPVAHDAYYGHSGRATVQGAGSSVGLSWLANVGNDVSPVTGGFRVETISLSPDETNIAATRAWLQWDRFTFAAAADSLFTDLSIIPDTVDIIGPNGRATLLKGQPLLGYRFLQPENAVNDPNGLYGNVSAEMPNPEIDLSVANAGATKTTQYSSYSRYPDFVATLRYQEGDWGTDSCTKATSYVEQWHVQFGSVFRDLSVEQSNTSNQGETTGFGLQLSGGYAIERGPCCNLRDYLFFSVTGGKGVARYFNDLSLINPINDAAYNGTDLSLVPICACYAGFEHEWTQQWRSTITYGHISLENPQAGSALAYHTGDYLSVNLIRQFDSCANSIPHHAFLGLEYLYGQREDFKGDFGADNRVMFVVAATK